jgi:hypothetical protein
MTPYLFALTLLVLGSLLVMFKGVKKIGIVLFVFLGFSVVLIAGLRHNIGHDYWGYVETFVRIRDFKDILPFYDSGYYSIHGEYGYLILNFLVKTLGLGYNSVFFLMALITSSCVFYAYKKYCNYYILAVLIYYTRFFFIRDMGQIRQGAACAILLLAIKHIYEKNIKSFLLIVLIAGSFHSVAYVFIPIYFLNRIQISDSLLKKLLIASVFIGLVSFQRDLINTFSSFLPQNLLNYTNSATYGEALGIFNPVAILQIGIMFVAIKYNKLLMERVGQFYYFKNIYALSPIILFSLQEIGIVAGRIATVFASVEPIILTSLVFVFKNKIIPVLLIIIYCLLIFYTNLYGRWGELLVPYNSVLQ